MSMAIEPVRPEVVSSPTIEELTAEIRREHEACVEKLTATIAHAFRVGEALLEIRRRLMKSGDWTRWLEAEAPIGRTQAYRYMRITAYRDHLPESVDGIHQADNLLAGLPAIEQDRGRARLPDPAKEDARRWRSEGLGYKAIAKRLGVSPSTVHNWFNETKKAHQARAARALREQKQSQKIRDAVRKQGGAIAEAYSMVERLDDVLGQAHREAEDPSARRDIARGHEHFRAMRDAVVCALGVES